MSTTVLIVFIVGLGLTAVFGGLCGHFMLKLLLRMEKDQRNAERAQQAADAPPAITDDKTSP